MFNLSFISDYKQSIFAGLLLCWSGFAVAAEDALPLPLLPDYSQLYVFGDSLSDSGNLYALTGGMNPPAPYNQRFSEGLVWSEYLVGKLGLEFNPMTNYAVAGAFSGESCGCVDLPHVNRQVAQYITGLTSEGVTADPAALYTIWAGANNFLLLDETATSDSVANVIGVVLSDVMAHATSLSDAGAQNIVITGLPDLGLTPQARASGVLGMSVNTAISNQFNAALQAQISQLSFPATYFNVEQLLRNVTAQPIDFGLSNVAEACLNLTTAQLCDTPADYLFLDNIHPTDAGHQHIAQGFFETVRQPRFKAENATLYLPYVLAIDSNTGETIGYFDVTMIFENTTGLFVVDQLEPVTQNSRMAEQSTFDLASNTLSARSVIVGDIVFHGEFAFIPEEIGLSFEFLGVSP